MGQIVDVLFGNNNFPLTVNPTRLPEGVAETVFLLKQNQIIKRWQTSYRKLFLNLNL